MTKFIDLDRRFREPTDEELGDMGRFGFLRSYDFQPGVFGWPKLLKYSRVILLAEAGSGKTREMQEQAKKLTKEGLFAFFAELALLNAKGLADSSPLESKNVLRERLRKWKSDGKAPAWFFLDAVDELKLTAGKLDQALKRLSEDVDGHLHHARVIISCRPSDWRPDRNLATVRHWLPVPQGDGDISARSSEEVFLDSLKQNQDVNIFRAEESTPSQDTTLQTVAMLPMSGEQIERFAEKSGMNEPVAFLEEVFKQKVWSFAHRPLDLIQLIATWSKSRHLGTRAEQHEDNVQGRLEDNPERPDQGVLTDEKARLGAERLALALALTRTRTIRFSDQTLNITRTDNVLEAAEILPDWTEEERQTLLRRGLFDPATYGRVRFHHRSVQEYLAACRLRALRDKGMSIKEVFRWLFAEQYDVKVVFPSMREIAAWLALLDKANAVCNKLIEREPEALLSLGDPETLDLATRKKVLRAFVATYGQGGRCGFGWEIFSEIPRFADPRLASVIRECWGNDPKNEEVRRLLLEMIHEGPIVDCADLAHQAARDPDWDPFHRITAIQAMLACGLDDAVREIADDMLLKESSWPNEIVRRIVEYMFPKIITADELVTLMEQRPESDSITGSFAWASRGIAATIETWSRPAVAFRDKMADLIWRERTPIQQFYPTHSRFDHLSEALARLCDRQLSEEPHRHPDDDLIRACVIASLFDSSENGWRKPFENLRAHFKNNVTLRSPAFWTELACIDEDIPDQNDRDDFQNMQNMQGHSLTGFLTEIDRPWLETAIADKNQPERRGVALHAWIRIWREHGRDASALDTIRPMLKNDPALEQIFAENTAPPEQDEERQEHSPHEPANNQGAQNDHQAPHMQQWKKWRDDLLANPEDVFSEKKRENTVYWLFRWWCGPDLGSKYNIWNKEAITQAFNRDIADRAEQAMQKFWRTATPPVLWSARPVEERSSTPRKWFCGLWCVLAEASTPEWANSLSPDEARTAAIYATVELNNFPSFIIHLATSHPEEVDEIIGVELTTELDISDSDDLPPILHKLTSAPDRLKQLLAPRLLDALLSGAKASSQEKWGVRRITSVLSILHDAIGEENREKRREIAQKCAERYEADPAGPLALIWLKGLFRFNTEAGIQVLIAGLADSEYPVVRERAIEIFADFFGDHDVVVFKIADPERHAEALGQLVRYAYIFIRPEEDQSHEGAYSPDTRDNAQRARSFLLDRLLGTPGPEAHDVALNLINENVFDDRSDYIRFLVRKQTATDAEFAPHAPEDVVELERRFKIPPQDRNGLFRVMMDRLEDLQHYFTHDDFTDRVTVRNIKEEMEMQRTLAWRIRDKANGAYKVTREEEVADNKRPDIRLWTVKNDQKAAVEVKIAYKYSLTQLEKALRNQLVGQYLRPSYCKAGCLLLTHHKKERYWMCPKTGKRLNFSEAVAWLNDKAQALEQEKQDIRLAVFGLDLTDP